MNFKEIKELKDRIIAGGSITRDEAIQLSQTTKIDTLYYSANQLRAKFCGYKYDICTKFNVILSKCKDDCLWCPMSTLSKIDYATDEHFSIDNAIETTNAYYKDGVSFLELATTDNAQTEEKLDKMIEYFQKIGQETKINLCASLGTLTYQQLLRIKNETRCTRIQCNIETSERFYPTVCTTGNYQNKLDTLRMAKELGFDVCSGVMLFIGENMEDRIDMALTLSKLKVKSIVINILNPFKGTPSEEISNKNRFNNQEILTTIAIFRFINPRAKIRFVYGRSLVTIIKREAIHAGLNSAAVGAALKNTPYYSIAEERNIFESEGFKI